MHILLTRVWGARPDKCPGTQRGVRLGPDPLPSMADQVLAGQVAIQGIRVGWQGEAGRARGGVWREADRGAVGAVTRPGDMGTCQYV